MRKGTMTSSHGEVDFDADTGAVIGVRDYDSDDSYLSDIARVDVGEWKREYPGEDIANHHDILDFGTWGRSGKYDGPCLSWRTERRQMQDKEREHEQNTTHDKH